MVVNNPDGSAFGSFIGPECEQEYQSASDQKQESTMWLGLGPDCARSVKQELELEFGRPEVKNMK